MLDKDLYDSWKSRMELYMQNREHRRMILESVENGPLIWPTVEENGVIRTKKYAELSAAEKISADCFVVPIFSSEDDLIACLNKAMAFLTTVASSRFPSTNNQLRTSSNPRNQATIQDGRGNATSSRGNTTSGQARVIKCYNCQGEGHISRQCTQPKRLRNAAWYKEKAMLAEAQEAGQILDEGQLAFLADSGILADQTQTIIPYNAAFQTEDLDTYDSDCDDLSTAQAVLMANISNYGSDIISEDFEQIPVMDFTDNEISSDSNIIPYSQYLQETQQATVQDTNLQAQQDSMILSVIEQMSEQMINHMIDSQMDDMIREKLALKEQIDSLEQHLSKQIKEKESLFKTFTVFKNESKEKEDKYMENEIDLEKKIKELDNIICKVGQSAQTVHMLTKPQAFYDNTHKQALEVQIVFDQMDAVVQQSLVDKQCLEISKKEILLENDRLLQKIMSQDVMLTVMNSMSLNNDSVNMEMQECESCEKCLNLDANHSKSKQAYNDFLKNYSQLEKHCISLEATMQLQKEVFQNDE
ncbi:integrase, catalytic region, zinc finger, CCHC-type containing protein [Tanacetum coccineum]